jgi:uncharacterized protein (DUF58 family)
VLTVGSQRQVLVRWRLSGHGRRLVTLALAGLFIAVITKRPEFAGLAAPALLLLIPARARRPASVDVALADDCGLLTEGDQATVGVRITGLGEATATVQLRPAAWITPGEVRLGADGWFWQRFRADLWGTRPPGTFDVTLHDRWRLAEGRLTIGMPALQCYPLPARLDSLVVLSKLPARLGEHAARVAGEGMEFAGVREFVPGDRQRRINWPATTRSGTLQLNTFAAERAQTVVMLADLSTDVGPPGGSSVDLAIRATVGAATAYLTARDRVGLISFGRQVRWIVPAPGQRQAHKIMNLIMTDSGLHHETMAITGLPHAALPAGALIIVFSPLLSLRMVEALRELRERGFATIVVDVLCAEPGARTNLWPRDRRAYDLAKRIWRMEQQAIRFSLREIGIPVVHWDGKSSLDEPLAPFTRRAMVNRS